MRRDSIDGERIVPHFIPTLNSCQQFGLLPVRFFCWHLDSTHGRDETREHSMLASMALEDHPYCSLLLLIEYANQGCVELLFLGVVHIRTVEA